jgi:positive regulator of sigma E activity
MRYEDTTDHLALVLELLEVKLLSSGCFTFMFKWFLILVSSLSDQALGRFEALSALQNFRITYKMMSSFYCHRSHHLNMMCFQWLN